jgi:signal transduction histidine kinase
MTGVDADSGSRETIDVALHLHPDTETVAVITDTTNTEKDLLADVHTELLRHQDKVKEIDLVGPPTGEMLERVAALLPHTVVLFQMIPHDADQPALDVYYLIAAVGQRLPTYSIIPDLVMNRGGIGGATYATVAAPRFNGDGSFAGFIGSAVDVTNQKLAQEALEKVGGGQLIAAQEKERSHLARELYDDICQRLAMLSLRIEKVTRRWSSSQKPVSEQLEEIWQQCSTLTGDVQALSHELHPSILDNLGLVTAVKSFCRELSQQNGAVVDFTDRNIPPSLPREVSLSLFRVIQEALHNAVKYSGQGARTY